MPRGREFIYLRSDGRKVADEASSRIRSLALAPVYRDVWICAGARGWPFTAEDFRTFVRHDRGARGVDKTPCWNSAGSQAKNERSDCGRRRPVLSKAPAICPQYWKRAPQDNF